jgi:hypothetical protein
MEVGNAMSQGVEDKGVGNHMLLGLSVMEARDDSVVFDSPVAPSDRGHVGILCEPPVNRVVLSAFHAAWLTLVPDCLYNESQYIHQTFGE